ncbi:MAG: hypothetical protein P3W91_003050 [Fervidobacterium sp.]|nr:hypothetical protein [Fervidobacterium sp.]
MVLVPEQVVMVPVDSYWTWFHKGRFFVDKSVPVKARIEYYDNERQKHIEVVEAWITEIVANQYEHSIRYEVPAETMYEILGKIGMQSKIVIQMYLLPSKSPATAIKEVFNSTYRVKKLPLTEVPVRIPEMDEVRFLEWIITDISGKFPILLSGDEVFDRRDINKPYFDSFYEVLNTVHRFGIVMNKIDWQEYFAGLEWEKKHKAGYFKHTESRIEYERAQLGKLIFARNFRWIWPVAEIDITGNQMLMGLDEGKLVYYLFSMVFEMSKKKVAV